MIYKADRGKGNYSQRNNEIKPLESCQVTSMCMAIDYMGWEFPTTFAFRQPEDALRNFIENNAQCKEIYDNFVKMNKWAQGIPAVECHDVLNRCTNLWMGKNVTKFVQSISVDGLVEEIKAGRPCVISGRFPYKSDPVKVLNHVVCLVGYNSETNEVCYDDPYGKTYEWSPNVSGNDVWVSWNQFVNDIKDCGNRYKFAHLFFPKEA